MPKGDFSALYWRGPSPGCGPFARKSRNPFFKAVTRTGLAQDSGKLWDFERFWEDLKAFGRFRTLLGGREQPLGGFEQLLGGFEQLLGGFEHLLGGFERSAVEN